MKGTPKTLAGWLEVTLRRAATDLIHTTRRTRLPDGSPYPTPPAECRW